MDYADPRKSEDLVSRRDTLSVLLALGLAAQWRSVFSQAGPSRSARVAFLSAATAKDKSTGFLAVCALLAKSGWIEGKTISYDWRFTAGERDQQPRRLAELVALRPDVLVVAGSETARAAIGITRSIPIVVWASLDPVAAGIAESLARPAGNVTGVLWSDPAVAAKIVDMTRETVPTIRRIGVLFDADYPGVRPYIDADRSAAAALGIEFREYGVSRVEDLLPIPDALKKDRVDALKVGYGGVISVNEFQRIVDQVSKHRMPVVSTLSLAAEQGALLAYGPPTSELARIVANHVDKILRGSKPAEVPFEYAKQMELTINAKTAKKLGITIPQSILLRAERVIGSSD